METEQLNIEKLNSEEVQLIATKFSCSQDYVRKLATGVRDVKSRQAKLIFKVIELVSANKLELKKSIEQTDIEGE